MCNFDTTFRGRNEVQKNKWTPYCQTEFDGESEKITVLHLENFYFRANTVLKKKALKTYLGPILGYFRPLDAPNIPKE
jgi:hypothetical protein